MANKLGVYRNALRYLGERKLASLTEDREPRHALDDVYDDGLLFCLEQGFWNFAMRTVEITASAGLEPSFGYTNAFDKPDDWVRTYMVSSDERLYHKLNDGEFSDESGVWYADCDPLYVKFVSSSAQYGSDLSLWPVSYLEYVSAYLAWRISFTITTSDGKADSLEELVKKRLTSARAKDAMNEGAIRPPLGTWVTSRGDQSYNRSRWDRRS